MVKALFAFRGVVETCMMSSEKTRILKIRGTKESKSPFMESTPSHLFESSKTVENRCYPPWNNHVKMTVTSEKSHAEFRLHSRLVVDRLCSS